MMLSLTKGYLCPTTPFNGEVHSVFRRSMNIKTDLVDTPWVSLLDTRLPATPTAYQCDFESIGALTNKIKVGDSLFMRGGMIRLKSAVNLEINTLTARKWQQAPALLTINHYRIKNNVGMTEALLGKYISSKEKLTIHSAAEYIQHLGLILPNCIYTHSDKLAKNIGHGKGLTPSGDDFLIGVLAVLSSLTTVHPQAETLFNQIKTAIQLNINKTNEISAHYLTLALCHHFSHPVQWLIHDLFTATDASTLNHRVMANLNIGASSGADTLAGIVYCLNNVLLN